MFRTLPRARLAFLMLGAPLLASMASGCVHHHYYDAQVHDWEPPPHAPAHGYRHHHHGVTLVFDSALDCYVVWGQPDHYFYEGHYYRFHAGGWQSGTRPRGPWAFVAADTLSPALRHRQLTRERGEAVKERREERREVAKEHREERREAVKEHRDEQREAAKEHREERREAVKDHREEHREAVKEQRDEHREAAKELRDEQREAVKEHGDEGRPDQVPASHR